MVDPVQRIIAEDGIASESDPRDLAAANLAEQPAGYPRAGADHVAVTDPEPVAHPDQPGTEPDRDGADTGAEFAGAHADTCRLTEGERRAVAGPSNVRPVAAGNNSSPAVRHVPPVIFPEKVGARWPFCRPADRAQPWGCLGVAASTPMIGGGGARQSTAPMAAGSDQPQCSNGLV